MQKRKDRIHVRQSDIIGAKMFPSPKSIVLWIWWTCIWYMNMLSLLQIKTFSYQSHYVIRHLYDSNSTVSVQTTILYISLNIICLNWLRHLPGLISYADRRNGRLHHNDVIMSVMAYQITGVSIFAQLLTEAMRRAISLCAGKSPVTGEFPAQEASNAVNVPIWWRHHETLGNERFRDINVRPFRRICNIVSTPSVCLACLEADLGYMNHG